MTTIFKRSALVISIFGFSIPSTLAFQQTEHAKVYASDGTTPGRDIAPEMVLVPYPDEEAIALGEGFDLITGHRKPIKCITMGTPERVNFYNKDTNFSEVTDEESLWEKLNMSISARASYAGYSGGGSYSSSVETSTSTTKITTVVGASLKTYAMMLPSPTGNSASIDLTSTAQEELAKTPTEFRNNCGDGFVSQITYGADLYGIFDYFKLDYEKKQKTTEAVDGAGPASVFKVNADSTFESNYKLVQTNTKVHVIEQGGDPGDFAIDRGGLVDSFKSLGKRAKDHERPIFLTVLRYSSLPSGRNKNYLEIVGGLEGMIRRVLRLKTLVNDYNLALVQRRQKPDDAEYIFISNIEGKDRTRDGMQTQHDHLLDEIKIGQKQIALCMDKTSSQNCNNARLSDDSDLEFRALAPLPSNVLSATRLKGLRDLAGTGVEPVVKDIKCKVADLAFQYLILRTDKVRCDRENKCKRYKEDLLPLQDKVYKSFDTTPQQCGTFVADGIPAAAKETLRQAGEEINSWRKYTDRRYSLSERRNLSEIVAPVAPK